LRERAATAPALSGSQSQTFSVEKRILKDGDAFKKTVKMDPSFTMRAKLELVPGSTRARPVTEYGPDIDSKRMDVCRLSSPKYTVKSRWKDLPDLKANDPGPGYYPEKALLSRSHPTLSVPPKWKLGTQERNTMCSDMPTDNPSPDKYDASFKQTRDRVLHPSVRGRINSFTVPGKKGIWATVGASEEEERKMYDVRHFVRKGGVAQTPKWTMTGRPESTLVPKGILDNPGPGHNSIPGQCSGGKQKRPPSFSFSSAPRWGKEQAPRPY
jgi:hypothetical protein